MLNRPITIVVPLWFAVVCSATILVILAILGSAALSRRSEPAEKYMWTHLSRWYGGEKKQEALVRMDKVTGKTEIMGFEDSYWVERAQLAPAKSALAPEKK